MLKVLHNCALSTTAFASGKCGEIHFQGVRNFTIFCSFCDMKSFEYEDFLLHFKNNHLDDMMLKVEEECFDATSDIVKKECDDEGRCLHEPFEPYCEEFGQTEDDGCLIEPLLHMEDEKRLTVMDWHKDTRSDDEVSNKEIDEINSDNDNFFPAEEPTKDEKKEPILKKPSAKKVYKCEHCGKIVYKPGRLDTHIKKAHPEQYVPPQPIKCTECDQVFTDPRRRNTHSIKEHGGLPCCFCGRRFKSKDKLNRHMETHTRGKEPHLVCDFENCNKRFFTNRQLYDHKHRHTGIKNCICDICGYTCRSITTLRCHFLTHSDERPYACDSCELRFKAKHHLIRHAEIHTHGNQRTFLCDFDNCTKSFFTSRQLADHKRRHTGEKKYVCDICGYSCRANQALKMHYRTHTGGLPYNCDTSNQLLV